MAITNGYATLREFKRFVWGEGQVDDTVSDDRLENYVETGSRLVDDICGRRFYATTETRYYTPEKRDMLRVFDLLSVSTDGLKTDEDGDRTYEVTWATTDYDLMPFSAALDGEPYMWLAITPNGSYTFPTGVEKSVELAGSYGYASTTPDKIHIAAMMAGKRLWERKSSILGIGATTAFGELSVIEAELRKDPDFMLLLDRYIKRW